MDCDFSSNNNIWARFYEFLWRSFWISLGYFYYDRLIGISRMSFLAAILNWNFRFLTNFRSPHWAFALLKRDGGPRVVVSTAAFHARVRGSVPGLGGLKETKLFLPHPRVKVSIVGSLRDREVTCSVSDRQGSNFEFCVWRTVSSQSSHHP